MLTDIKQLLPRDKYNAIVGANTPSASNVFATMLDLAGLGSGIYGGSGTLQVGDTTVTMAATDKLLFNSLNGPYDLFTIDAVNNRIGIGIATPGHTFHMVAGNMFIQDGVAAIGTTTPSAGQMLKISAGDTQISANLLQGVRIDLSPLASAGALNAWGVDVRHDDARSGAGTKQFFMFDANYTGSSASAGTHTNYGIRSRATMTVGGTANVTNIGGYFEAANGTNNYAIQIVDGSQGLNKVLRSDANGVGSWVDINTLVTPATTLYSGDGTVGAGRVATLTDSIQFGSAFISNTQTIIGATTTASTGILVVKALSNGTDQPFAIRNNVDTFDLFKVQGNGNVGIGDTIPEGKLQVAGMIRAMSTTAPTLTTGKSIEFYFNASSDQGRILAYDRDTAQYKDMVIGNGATPNKFTIFKSGNVGIGTEVDGGAKLSVRAFSTGTDKALVVRNNTDTLDLFSVRGNGSIIYGNNPSGTIDYGHTFKTESLTYSGKLMQITSENSGADYYNFDAGSLIVSSVNTVSGGFMNNVARISFTATFTKSNISSRYDGDNALSFQNDNVVAGSSSAVYNNNENNGFRVYLRNGTSKYVGDTVMAAKSLARVQIGGNGSYASIPSTTAKVSIDGDSYTNALDVTGSVIVNGDIETLGNTNGLVVLDRTDTNRYRIYTDNGVLHTELV